MGMCCIPGRRETYRNPKAARGLAAIGNVQERHETSRNLKRCEANHIPIYIKAAINCADRKARGRAVNLKRQ